MLSNAEAQRLFVSFAAGDHYIAGLGQHARLADGLAAMGDVHDLRTARLSSLGPAIHLREDRRQRLAPRIFGGEDGDVGQLSGDLAPSGSA
jgi:hypothetical protein